jgi:tetratricopeptide (TPR) repeat protein
VTTQLRRFMLASLFVLAFVGIVMATGSAQQAQGQGASATQTPTPAPAPAQPGPRPEQAAMTAAAALNDPAARLAAFEKVRTDFPQSPLLSQADNAILQTLVNSFPDRVSDIATVFDRIIGRIPASAAPDTRLSALIAPIGIVSSKKLLLDKSEPLLTAALGALDPAKYAQTAREAAARANRELTDAQIESQFGSVRSRGLEALARVYTAQGNNDKALETYKEAVKASPAFGTATQTLVDLYTAKGDYASAEAILKNAVAAAATPAAATRPQQVLADLYIKKGDDAAAESLLKEIVKANATLGTALVPLARLEAKRGDNAAALDHFMTAALAGSLKPADEAAMKALWAKKNNGNEAGLDEALDKAYRDKFPNPVTPEKYAPTPARTNKLVLLEMFTGSGCPPCVASDLALDAVMVRYGDHIASLVYHEHIPQPDPMVAANNNDRRLYYSVNGVPTFEIDGAMVANPQGSNPGGGPRTNTAPVYASYTASIDKFLETPARAALTVSATGEGDQISATVNVTSLPADAKDLRLHIVLAEKELRFTGENGIRFHPMVVRATVGDKGAGLPITSTGTTKVTFSLNQIRDEVTKSLAAELEKRRKTEAPGSTPREYMAEGRAYTAIDTSELVVVAFVQEGPYRAPKPAAAAAPGAAVPAGIAGGAAGAAAAPAQTPAPPRNAADPALANILNAAQAHVVFTPAPKAKGGGR